ncbi:MCE family protein [Actinomadura violacea]|uniref:MCE family protein n=1 Tax=Actinomadura violacea TaxID=2819934 RepID=A0ABS3RLL3_9ACTN|nr:MCE family protein [Actinomadura violacea]MBO2457562.1 MCE family protein [Actinomadura violacea]
MTAPLLSPLVKSATFLAVTATATAVLAMSITNASGGSTRSYHAVFTDVTGLNSGDTVRIAGVRVGQVKQIKVSGRRLAKVTFTVDADRDLPASTTAAVKYLNLVGQRYLDLGQGAGDGGTLRRGGTIPVSRTTAALSLNALFTGFQPLMAALSPSDVNQLSQSIVQVLQGQGGTVEQLVSSIGSLTSTLASRDQVIGQLITNLDAVVRTVNDRDRRLVSLITTLRGLVSGLAADRKQIGGALQGIGDLTSSTAGLFADGREPLHESIAGLNDLSGNLAKNKTVLERFLTTAPGKMAAISRTNSYGSWANFYRCEIRVTGVTYTDGSPPPTGIPITDDRCEPGGGR